MKILVCSCGVNSFRKLKVGVFQLDQARALHDLGHDVRIVTLDLRSFRRWRSLRSERFEQDGMQVFTVNGYYGNVPRWLINPAGKRLAKKVYCHSTSDGWIPDIIHAHFTDMAYFFADVAKENHIPFIITEHSSAITKEPIDEKTKEYARYAYPKADALIAVSSHLADIIRKKFNVKPVIVPNIVDLNIFQKATRRIKTPKSVYSFVTAAYLNRGKGMDILLEAFSKLEYSDIHLTILGDGAEMQALKHQANQLGIEEKVAFFGSYDREQFRDVLSKSNCFVLASRGETFGVVYIEAMAAGIPVIATRCGGPVDFIDKNCGLLVDVDNVIQLTEAMKRMYATSFQYDSKKISEVTAKRFSANTVATSLEEIFLEILRKHNN